MDKCLRCKLHINYREAKHGFHNRCFQEEFNLASDDDFVDLVPRKSNSSPVLKSDFQSRIASSFFHGAFKKYSSRMGQKKYILKVQEEKYPELPHVEFLSNKLAEFMGVKVADYHFIMFNNEVPTFVTRNFLDDYPAGNLVHIWHYLKQESIDEFNCENLLNIIFNETQRPLDQRRFIEICLFDMIVGNHDRHGRNLAIIEMKGKKILAPCYDNPSYIGIEDDFILGANLCPKGKIFTSNSQEPDISDYIREFTSLGHGEVVTSFFDRIQVEKIEKLVLSSSMTEKRKAAILKLIKENMEKAKNEFK
ncbi:MAG: hypothetical protein CME64_06880 [Halobacteriovoraceae bacterium]|nr:hypothetical protein [Halobacteriovoraceae bacterium]